MDKNHLYLAFLIVLAGMILKTFVTLVTSTIEKLIGVSLESVVSNSLRSALAGGGQAFGGGFLAGKMMTKGLSKAGSGAKKFHDKIHKLKEQGNSND